jgi:hypothetical protein
MRDISFPVKYPVPVALVFGLVFEDNTPTAAPTYKPSHDTGDVSCACAVELSAMARESAIKVFDLSMEHM